MELIDRYLQAVGFWLPRKQREDILAELSEDLHSQVEEQEAKLGRKLAQPEIECLLKMRGRPVLVANRYLPQQYLIGPVLFPIYKFVLMVVGLCYLVPWVLVGIGLMVYSPAYRAQHIHEGWFKGILSVWGSLWFAAFIALTVVTIVFAAIERGNASSHFLEEWEPRKLPAVRDRNRIPRSSSIFELAALLAFCVWWIGYMGSPVLINRPDLRIVMSPLWSYFFWGFGLASVANLVISAVNVMRPYWSVLRATLRLLFDLAASCLFCWVMKSHILAEISVANVSTARTLEITNQINLWAERAFPIAVIAGVVIAAVNVYRIVRAKTGNNGVRQQAVATLS
ncbi:MAG TPA: hypothetical protein VI685_01215 [Candidatus Angelobacter sp.]